MKYHIVMTAQQTVFGATLSYTAVTTPEVTHAQTESALFEEAFRDIGEQMKKAFPGVTIRPEALVVLFYRCVAEVV